MLVKNMMSILLVVMQNPAVSPWSFASGTNCCGVVRIECESVGSNVRSERRYVRNGQADRSIDPRWRWGIANTCAHEHNAGLQAHSAMTLTCAPKHQRCSKMNLHTNLCAIWVLQRHFETTLTLSHNSLRSILRTPHNRAMPSFPKPEHVRNFPSPIVCFLQ